MAKPQIDVTTSQFFVSDIDFDTDSLRMAPKIVENEVAILITDIKKL